MNDTHNFNLILGGMQFHSFVKSAMERLQLSATDTIGILASIEADLRKQQAVEVNDFYANLISGAQQNSDTPSEEKTEEPEGGGKEEA